MYNLCVHSCAPFNSSFIGVLLVFVGAPRNILDIIHVWHLSSSVAVICAYATTAAVNDYVYGLLVARC